MKTLIIVESPSKAKTIQKYLGDNYIVKASQGHIADLIKAGDFNLGIDIHNQYTPKYVLSTDRIGLFQDIINTAKKCDKIILCSDPDREGEAIAWHLYERLKDLDIPIKRAKYNEITKEVISKALKTAGDIHLPTVRAQEARRVLDRMVGFMTSPYVCQMLKQKQLSAGRVQSVVVKIITDREKEIQSFVPEVYYTIQTKLEFNSQQFIAKYENKITSQQECNDILKVIKDKKSVFYVKEVVRKKEVKNPPAPFITSTIQQVMSKAYKMSAEKTSAKLQALYEAGLITYIRTDAPTISDDALSKLISYLDENNILHPKKPFKYTGKESAQGAHECIRPTDINYIPNDDFCTIDQQEQLLYNIIRKQFIACQANPAIFNTLKVIIGIKDSDITLVASGKALEDPGYMSILNIKNDNSIDIPNLNKKDLLLFVNAIEEKKKTQPPPRYSESVLLKKLTNDGIGRPSTYASLLSKIGDRHYVEKNNEIYYPTELGNKVISILDCNFSFMDYYFTAKVEEELDLIEKGEKTYFEVIDSFFKKFKKELDNSYINNNFDICPKCGSVLIERKSSNGIFKGCNNYPRCKFISE